MGKLILKGLLITEDNSLVVQDGAHVVSEGIHILAYEDLVLLGLILADIKLSSEVLHMVLKCSGRTDRVLLREWLWWWGLGGGLPGFSLGAYEDPKPRPIRSQLILIENSFPKSYASSSLGTPGLSFLTMIVLIWCMQASLSSKGTPACLHRP